MLHLPCKHLGTITFIASLAAGSAGGALAQAPESGHVIAVRHWSLGDVTRIAIETDGDFTFRSDHLDNPDRIFFDIVGARPESGSRGVQTISVRDQFVKQIRVAETQKQITRVVLDLASAAEFTTSRLENPPRLIIELHGTTAQAKTPAPKETVSVASVRLLDRPPAVSTPRPNNALPETQTVVAPPPPLPPPAAKTAVLLAKPSMPAASTTPSTTTPATPVETPQARLGSRLATVEAAVAARKSSSGDESMVRVLGLKIGKIVIDAGHGGHDTGTIGPDGLEEKDLVLDVAKRLGALLENRLGSEVIYTRSDDTFIPLERRTQIANEAKADLFLSIHANSSPVPAASGIETYYLSFTTSKAALDVAARENATSAMAISDLQDLLQKIALKDKVDESREFASRVQDALFSASAKANARTRDRGVRKAPFVVLIGASMPSVLAEIGFLSNPHDEALMNRPEHRQKLAEALYKGVSSYAGTLSHFQVAAR